MSHVGGRSHAVILSVREGDHGKAGRPKGWKAERLEGRKDLRSEGIKAFQPLILRAFSLEAFPPSGGWFDYIPYLPSIARMPVVSHGT